MRRAGRRPRRGEDRVHRRRQPPRRWRWPPGRGDRSTDAARQLPPGDRTGDWLPGRGRPALCDAELRRQQSNGGMHRRRSRIGTARVSAIGDALATIATRSSRRRLSRSGCHARPHRPGHACQTARLDPRSGSGLTTLPRPPDGCIPDAVTRSVTKTPRDRAALAGTDATSQPWRARRIGTGETCQTVWDRVRSAHNPEVAGSNPAPATNVSAV